MPRLPTPWFRRHSDGRPRGWYATMSGKQISLGVKDPDDIQSAIAALQRLLSVQTDPSGQTVAAAVPAYLEAIRHRVCSKTHRGYTAALRWFSLHFGPLPCRSVDPLEVERRAAGESKWSNSHRANLLWLCQAVVQHAGRKDFTLRRPPKESRGAEMVISAEGYAKILRDTTGDFHQLIRVMWSTGARPSEVCGLTCEGIDWPNGTATLRHHKTAGKGKRRVLYFSPEALAVLAEQRAKYGTGWLFRGVGGEPLTAYKLNRRFTRLSEKLGVDASPYSFRHSYISRSLAAGVPDTVVAALVGHSSTAMIHAHYSHISEFGRVLRDAAKKMDDAA